MKSLICACLLVGCSGSNPPDLVDAPMGMGSNTMDVSGHITASATWTGTINVTAATTIDPGVTVTVAAGTAIDFATGSSMTLSGTLAIQGTSAAKVHVYAKTAGAIYGGFTIPAGGQLTTSYMVQTGGGIHLSGSGKATLIDSQMSHHDHDFLTMSGGTVDMEYSWLGVEPGLGDTTHCDIHVDAATSIKVTHSNLSSAVYGIMFYGGTAADFTFDNWFGNQTTVDHLPGASGDFSNSYFDKGAPSGTGITAANLSTSRLTDAGPRP